MRSSHVTFTAVSVVLGSLAGAGVNLATGRPTPAIVLGTLVLVLAWAGLEAWRAMEEDQNPDRDASVRPGTVSSAKTPPEPVPASADSSTVNVTAYYGNAFGVLNGNLHHYEGSGKRLPSPPAAGDGDGSGERSR